MHQNRIGFYTIWTTYYAHVARVLQHLFLASEPLIATIWNDIWRLWNILIILSYSSRIRTIFIFVIWCLLEILLVIIRALISYSLMNLLDTLQVFLCEFGRSLTLKTMYTLNILLLRLKRISGAESLSLTQHFVSRRCKDRSCLSLKCAWLQLEHATIVGDCQACCIIYPCLSWVIKKRWINIHRAKLTPNAICMKQMTPPFTLHTWWIDTIEGLLLRIVLHRVIMVM